MLKPIPACLCACLLHTLTFQQVAQAATVFRCEDRNGKVTFTLHGCPTEQQQLLQSADNPTPGSGKPVPMAKVGKHKEKSDARGHSEQKVTGIAEPQDACGSQLAASARRKAIIQQEMHTGMTRADVENALGKPGKVSSQNGQTRYQYRDTKGRSRSVSFDENGCVRGNKAK
ncbi:DUF4124 domain-containing protein [Pseudomonas sp. UL073]|uniref:DUF4124 domain-containing protein n=1 Tax=Zestomonas insulae TaxID=2809017 RepID=A0ABS2I902_9GAMM|nr:DUF4124 domain-containing protein [Pseudomonas insulae]MBM7059616.1 DUF4124 domain-containing protein [Pseudomonas insulae]